jgi:predicted ATPase
MFEAVADVLRRLAGTSSVVVLLDDLHWAEPTALDLLRISAAPWPTPRCSGS